LAIVVAITIGSAAALVHPGPIPASAANNPLGVSGLRGSEAVWTVAVILILGSLAAALLLALAAVIVRLRRSEGVEQAQLKWFVAAIVAVCACVTLGFADGGYLGLAEGASPTGFDLLAYASQSLPPIAVGVAVLRYHLFEIDRIISRTLSWAMLTGLLGAVFIGLVVGLQAVFANVTRTNTLAVAASTLVVAALFQPLRRGIQSAVDRRFNRSRYDAERTVAEFATRLRNEVEITTVTTDLHGTVLRAVNPSSLGLWIREARP
jgi:hypothetical protein